MVYLRVTVTGTRCANGSQINQIAIGWHKHATNNSGLIEVTSSNWNETHLVPLEAVVDYKPEDSMNVSFTLKFVVDGATLNTTKIEVTSLFACV